MKTLLIPVVVSVATLAAMPAHADDVHGVDALLCSASQVSECWSDGECARQTPDNIGLPQFVEIDLTAKRIATTKASGLNRGTPIEFLRRQEGTIVLQGFERGRAFSFVIAEEDGRLTGAVAAEGRSVSVFGACTPLDSPR